MYDMIDIFRILICPFQQQSDNSMAMIADHQIYIFMRILLIKFQILLLPALQSYEVPPSESVPGHHCNLFSSPEPDMDAG